MRRSRARWLSGLGAFGLETGDEQLVDRGLAGGLHQRSLEGVKVGAESRAMSGQASTRRAASRWLKTWSSLPRRMNQV